MAKRCDGCKWFSTHEGSYKDRPHCRRYPPVHIGPERTRDGFVTVSEGLYCGEYKKRKR